jgi:hypothetical protein
VKTKTVIEIAPYLRFVDNFGLLDGGWTGVTFFFHSDHRGQVSDFGLMQLELDGRENAVSVGESGCHKSTLMDWHGFCLRLLLTNIQKAKRPSRRVFQSLFHFL